MNTTIRVARRSSAPKRNLALNMQSRRHRILGYSRCTKCNTLLECYTQLSWVQKNRPGSNQILKLLSCPQLSPYTFCRLGRVSSSCITSRTSLNEVHWYVLGRIRARIFGSLRRVLSFPNGQAWRTLQSMGRPRPRVSLLLWVGRRETLGTRLGKGRLCTSFHGIMKFCLK